ncbi:MAG: ABC transporter ATP-binding protein [Isosphaeraceae bacterium]|jgi:ABC-type multidrug transport system fused ATPase/permease subunit|nr:MAG: ABC transporter ATP-binding protein [Isosphaeraceae bacterium]
MKNFIRLVRFAWPYRLRFGLSLGCALMVAVLWFLNISAVYPLLQILFYHQNCQRWIGEQIAESETTIASLEARIGEVRAVQEVSALPRAEAVATLRERYREKQAGADARLAALREAQRRLQEENPAPVAGFERAVPNAALGPLRQAHAVAMAAVDELDSAMNRYRRGEIESLRQREESLRRELGKARKNDSRLRWLEPFILRFLPSDGFRTLVLLLAVVLAGVALKGVFQFAQDVLVADVTQLSLFDIRNLFFRRTMALDLASFSEQGSAELMARFTNDIDSVSQGYNTLLSKMVREPLRIITCLGGALWLNWRLTCLTLVIVPISALTTVHVGKILKRAVRRSLESMSTIYKILQECFQGIRVVKAYTTERQERRRFFRETKTLYRKSLRVAKIDAISDPVLELLSLMTVAIALLAGSYLVLYQTTTLNLGFVKLPLASQPMMIEDLLTLYTMLAGMSDPIRKLSNVHSKIQRAAAASDRICAMMDRRPVVVDKPRATTLPRHRRSIEFDDVHFGYSGREPVLRGVNLSVAHGERVAVVGPNGCGKSTLLNLLVRFWDVDAGAVRIDGYDVREVRLRSLRAQVGYVTQETILFEGTVLENIRYGSPHATRAQVEEAARRAYAHAFIEKLPQGYDTLLSERGMSLSGGQRQRLALARAFLRDPAILLLDEATSAIDIQDEALIRRAIEQYARGRTTILVTHSLATLQHVDRIVLMNGGRVEAIGTDAELRRTSALYRRLYEAYSHRESA